MDSIELEAEVLRLEKDRLVWIESGEKLGADVRRMSLVVEAAKKWRQLADLEAGLALCAAVDNLDSQENEDRRLDLARVRICSS